MAIHYICTYCESLCDTMDVDHGNYEEFWGAKVWRPVIETVSECCGKEAATVEEWIENDWGEPAGLDHADLVEHGFVGEHDGQPDEAQEWHDFDPDC